MKEKCIDLNGFKLHMIKTKKFKSISFKLSFRNNLNKEDITIRNALTDYLEYSCNKYKTSKEMNIKMQDLYGINVYPNTMRYGNVVVTDFTCSILNPKYTENGMLEESIKFFSDVILDPNCRDDGFDDDILKLILDRYKNTILSVKNSPSFYAGLRLNEMITDLPSSYRMIGYIEDLEKINSKNIYEYYKKFISEAVIDLYVIGDFNYEKMTRLVDKYFSFNPKNIDIKDYNLDVISNKSEVLLKQEETKNNQTCLAIGCLVNNINPIEREYIATLYSIILGNSPEAKLFMNVREKKSLAYTISSSFKRTDGILLISSGISYEHYEQALSAIKEEIDNMKNKISFAELNNAKKLYISVLKETYEYRLSILEYFYQMEYFDAPDINSAIEMVKNITFNDIYEFAKKVYIDSIFVLKEGE